MYNREVRNNDRVQCRFTDGFASIAIGVKPVGDQDVTKLAGHSKSLKHRKAESSIARGQAIRILRQSDFTMLLETAAQCE